MSNNNNNKTVVPQAKQALNQMKLEIANELEWLIINKLTKEI